MQVKLEWKLESLDEHTWRARVIGGWIVYTEIVSSKGSVSVTSNFVSDRDHQWVIKPPLKDETAAKESLAKDFAPKA